MKIAIVFGDNDFMNTFRGVMKTLMEVYRHRDGLPTDKKVLVEIINELSFGCYLAYQHNLEYSDDLESVKQYLKVSESKVLINDEVTKHMEEQGDDNFATTVLDTDLDYQGNSPVYSF